MTTLTSPAASLPVRRKMLPDEWPETYLGRLARANGIHLPWREDFERIRSVLNDPATLPDSAPAEYFASLPAWAVHKPTAQIRYCPACLENERYIRARWRIKSYEVCTIHNLHLKKGLVEPAITTAYSSAGKRRIDEITREEIWEGATCPIPQELEHARQVWSGFDEALATPGGSVHLDILPWALLGERLLDAIVTAGYSPETPLRGESRLHHRVGWLKKSKRELPATADAITAFIFSPQVHTERRAIAKSLSTSIKEEKQNSSIMSRLPLQEIFTKLLAASPESLTEINFGALEASMHPKGYVSLDRAESIIGCSAGLMLHIMRANFFSNIQKIRSGRKQYIFLEKNEVEACRRWFASCMSPEELMKDLCLNRIQYWALLDSRLLDPIHFSTWTRYRRKDIAALMARLESVAYPYPSSGIQLMPLMGIWLQKKGRPRIVVTKLLNEIWRGEIPVFRQPDGVGLQAYYVDARAISRALFLADAYRKEYKRKKTLSGQLQLVEAF